MSKARFYVGNVSWDASPDDLKQHFAAYAVTDVKIITDRDTGRSRGFAFIELEGATDEAAALLDGSELLGRTLKVSPALEREKRGGGERGGGGHGGKRGGGRERGGRRAEDYAKSWK